MDRNTLIAIVLTFLLVILYMRFYGPKPQQRGALATTNVVVQTGAPDAARAPDGSAAAETTAAAAGTSQAPSIAPSVPYVGALARAFLSNSLVTFTFSSFGGDISEIQIHRSDVVKRGPIITTRASSNKWEVPLRLRQAGELDLNDFALAPEKAGPTELVYTGMLSRTLLVRKHYRLDADDYLLRADVTLSNVSTSAVTLSNSFSVWLGQIDKVSEEADRYARPRGVDVCRLVGGKMKIVRAKSKKKLPLRTIPGPAQWYAVRNKYFTHIVIPSNDAEAVSVISIEPKTEKQVSAYAEFPAPSLAPGMSYTWEATLYAGPMAHERLKTLGPRVGKGGKYTDVIDLGMFSFLATPILVYGLKGLYPYVHNYGIAIIIITVIIKLITWPLQTKSFTSMQRMQQVQPQLKALQEKYKGDKAKLQQEMMLLYRKHGVNPLGGCLPMLLQLPIFFALFAALSRSIELWGAPFMWIPDLSMPDMVARLPFSIPFLGNGVNPLAIIMGGAMIGQQALMPSTGDANQKRMMYLMPVFMIFIFYKAPSGLVLYWLVNQIITMGQMFYLHYLKKK